MSLSEQTKKKISQSLKGHLVSKESRIKMSKAAKANGSGWKKGHKLSKESIEKARLKKLGTKQSDEWKKKAALGRTGLKRTPEQRKKMSLATMGRSMPKGKDSPRWKGGYENTLWHAKQRRIRKLEASGSHTLGEWEILKAQYNWTCPACLRKEPEIKLSEDHIIPLSKGGSDNIENIQPLCKPCNSKKSNKLIPKYNA